MRCVCGSDQCWRSAVSQPHWVSGARAASCAKDGGMAPKAPRRRRASRKRATRPAFLKQLAAARAAASQNSFDNALRYMSEVKDRFADRQHIYHAFVGILGDYRTQRIDMNEVIAHVKQLFKGHRDLILQFSMLLPEGFHIEWGDISDGEEEEEPPLPHPMQQQQQQQQAAGQSGLCIAGCSLQGGSMLPRASTLAAAAATEAAAADQKQAPTAGAALAYLRKVKAVSEQDYHTFLDIIRQHKTNGIDTNTVILRVKQLFKGHPELILGLNLFLPQGWEIDVADVINQEQEEN